MLDQNEKNFSAVEKQKNGFKIEYFKILFLMTATYLQAPAKQLVLATDQYVLAF